MSFLSTIGTLILVFILLLIIKSNIQKSEIDSKKTNKDSLYYIGLVFTLCVSVNSFLFIIFSIIDKGMPDAINNIYYYDYNYNNWMPSEVAMTIATLIVVFPLYVLFSYLIDKDIKQDPSKKDLTLRKSVIYLALIVTSLTILSLIITIIYSYLTGSFFNVFLLKSLAIFLVSALLFAYYYYSLNRDYNSSTKMPEFLTLLSILVVILTVGFSIYIFGNPSKVRDLSIDNNKVTDLATLSYSISNFYDQNKKLPENLDLLVGNLKDRETGVGYEYKIASASSSQYSLCATFKRDINYGNDYRLSTWNHQKGYHCFDLDALKKQYY